MTDTTTPAHRDPRPLRHPLDAEEAARAIGAGAGDGGSTKPAATPMIMQRVRWAVAIGVVLIAIVVGALSFTHSYAITDEGKRCAPSFSKSKWPMWFGCVMAAQEGLAAGLIGGAGALFAAWLAYDAIQEQLSEERERRLRQQAEAKETAVACIAQPIHAAASALFAIENAHRSSSRPNEANSDQLVDLAVTYVQTTLDSFTVREIFRDLGHDDRLIYLTIVSTLSTFVSTSTHRSPVLNLSAIR